MSPATDATARVRGASVGAMAAVVTVVAHGAGGAAAPSLSAASLLVGVCAAAGVVSAATRVSAFARLQLMATLAVAQGLGHLMLSVVDVHHHGQMLSQQMVVSHAAAIVLGALAIRAAELGARRAVSALHRVLPLLVLPIVDAEAITPPLPVYRVAAKRDSLDLSGSGTRGPPVTA